MTGVQTCALPIYVLGIKQVEDPKVHRIVSEVFRLIVVVKDDQLVNLPGLVGNCHQSHGQGGAVSAAGGNRTKNFIHDRTQISSVVGNTRMLKGRPFES